MGEVPEGYTELQQRPDIDCILLIGKDKPPLKWDSYTEKWIEFKP